MRAARQIFEDVLRFTKFVIALCVTLVRFLAQRPRFTLLLFAATGAAVISTKVPLGWLLLLGLVFLAGGERLRRQGL